MEISKQEAQQSLADIEQIMRQTRRAIALAGGPYYLILWGIIWMIGYLGSQFLADAQSGMLWGIIDAVGIIITFAIGWRTGQRIRSPMGPRLAALWLSLLVYGALLVWLASPTQGTQFAAIISLLMMLGYVITGLWLRGSVLIVLGAVMTLLTLVGYLALPGLFYLWMAVVGGGGLVGTGVYMLRSWS